MNFLADECVDGHIIRALVSADHAVQHIRDTDLGANDEHVLVLAHAGDIILITEDKDFGDLVFARNAPHSGVLLIRLDGLPPQDKVQQGNLAHGLTLPLPSSQHAQAPEVPRPRLADGLRPPPANHCAPGCPGR